MPLDIEQCTDEELHVERAKAKLACEVIAELLTDYRTGLEMLNREWGKREAVKFHAGL